jgi:hypothetical protein
MAEPGDTRILCLDCHNIFLLSAREKLFFEARALSQPKRCPGCRAQRRKETEQSGGAGSPSSSRAIGLAAETRGLRMRVSGAWR